MKNKKFKPSTLEDVKKYMEVETILRNKYGVSETDIIQVNLRDSIRIMSVVQKPLTVEQTAKELYDYYSSDDCELDWNWKANPTTEDVLDKLNDELKDNGFIMTKGGLLENTIKKMLGTSSYEETLTDIYKWIEKYQPFI